LVSAKIVGIAVVADKSDADVPLTGLEIRGAKPGARIIEFSDGGALRLWIRPDSAKRWRFADRLAGSQKALAVGVDPGPPNHRGAER
jgi:hypothetical protein